MKLGPNEAIDLLHLNGCNWSPVYQGHGRAQIYTFDGGSRILRVSRGDGIRADEPWVQAIVGARDIVKVLPRIYKAVCIPLPPEDRPLCSCGDPKCDFVTDPDTNKFYNVSYMDRYVPLPPYEDSDEETSRAMLAALDRAHEELADLGFPAVDIADDLWDHASNWGYDKQGNLRVLDFWSLVSYNVPSKYSKLAA